MQGKLIKVELKKLKTAEGKKFEIIESTIRCKVNDKNEVKTYRNSMGVDFAKKYYDFCGLTSKTAIGKDVQVRLMTRVWIDKEGNEREVIEAKYMNFLNDEGQAIVMPKADKEVAELPF